MRFCPAHRRLVGHHRCAAAHNPAYNLRNSTTWRGRLGESCSRVASPGAARLEEYIDGRYASHNYCQKSAGSAALGGSEVFSTCTT